MPPLRCRVVVAVVADRLVPEATARNGVEARTALKDEKPGLAPGFLPWLSPSTYEYICRAWTKEPERFTFNPLQKMPGLNI